MKILIAECKGFSSNALELLESRARVVMADVDRVELLREVRDTNVLWVRLRNVIDAQVMDAAPQLQVIVSNTTGLNHIDLEAAKARRIRVLSLRGEVDFLQEIRATAELTLGLALALARRIPSAHAHVCQGQWDRYQFKGHDLYQRTAGIVGYGRLGRIVAGFFEALGMHVLVTTRDGGDSASSDTHARVSLDTLLSESDLVSVHVNLTPDNHKIFGPKQFARMRRGAWLINTSRGELIDESALLAALRSGQLGGTALDVIAEEHQGTGSSHPLIEYARDHDNLIITPHIGGYTWESLARTEVFLAQKLVDAIDTLPAPGVCRSEEDGRD